MTCIDLRKHSRSKPSFMCVDPDDLCRVYGDLVGDGSHLLEDSDGAPAVECLRCGFEPGGAA